MAPSIVPDRDVLQSSLANPGTNPRLQSGATPWQARTELYPAFSVIDDAKDKTKKVGNEAVKSLEKASGTAQAKTGNIELYSGRYYAACTFGGLLACVSHCFDIFSG
jgi:solute carrier family 25 phosphate transporter 3